VFACLIVLVFEMDFFIKSVCPRLNWDWLTHHLDQTYPDGNLEPPYMQLESRSLIPITDAFN
jgi:hypothetical protein